MIKILKETKVGEVVSSNFKVAEIFEKYGIDFCCKGGMSLDAACQSKNIDPELFIKELTSSISIKSDPTQNFLDWPLDLLADYIEKKHHRYIREKTPMIQTYLTKLVNAHGSRYPQLIEVQHLFEQSVLDMHVHMRKEEMILFPYIRNKVQSISKSGSGNLFTSIQTPVNILKQDHEIEGSRFEKIAELTNQFEPSAAACITHKVCLSMLKEFELDLHHHIHLENNILFPKALALEN